MRARERHVLLRGVSVFVRDAGSGMPVVVFNGIGAHTEMLRPLEQALAGTRIISFDAPGTSICNVIPSSSSKISVAGRSTRLMA